jgi:GrpB-like predicted nucleotidyltransferase (UPF0157 family)
VRNATPGGTERESGAEPLQLPDEQEVRAAVERWERQVASGEVELLGEGTGLPVELVDPDPGWPYRFEELRARLAATLGPVAVRIDHVGSTSVPGLVAKPILDVQVSVVDIDDEARYRDAVESIGVVLRSREPEHRYFRPPPGAPRTVHVHVCPTGSDWERVHLLFRDYLRAHPERATAYGELKRALLPAYGADRLGYTEAKSPFIEETLDLAEAWAAETDWSLEGSGP